MKKSNKSLSSLKFSDKLFYDLLSSKIDMENELDHIKSELISHPLFNLTHLFQHLDSKKLRVIARTDIETFFKNVGLKINPEETESVLRYFTDSETIDFNSFFVRLVPLTGRPVSNNDSSIEDLLCKLFLSIIQHSQSVFRAKSTLLNIESLNMELICKDHQEFTLEDLESLFKKYGGWSVNCRNSSTVFNNKLKLNRQDLCSMIGIQYREKESSFNRSTSKGTDCTNDESLKEKGEKVEKSYHRTLSSSFFENEINLFGDHQMTQYEREMLYQ